MNLPKFSHEKENKHTAPYSGVKADKPKFINAGVIEPCNCLECD